MTEEKLTAKEAITRVLRRFHPVRMAVHEFIIFGHSQNAIATRLPEMAKDGLAESQTRAETRFKEWGLTEKGLTQS